MSCFAAMTASAYNLAVVVDDAVSGIDQVVRGDDLLPAAATKASSRGCWDIRRRSTRTCRWLSTLKDGGWPSETALSPSTAGGAGHGARRRTGPDCAVAGHGGSRRARHARRIARTFRSPAASAQSVGGQGSKVGHVIIWADGTVTGLRAQWKGAVELTVARRDAIDETEVPALAYTDLMAAPAGVGDRVLMNVAALERGLGTGGYALVIARPGRRGQGGCPAAQPSGHLVKARYLPLQAMVAGADEQGSAHHELLADADSIDGMPVVVADLRSALAPVLLAIENDRPGTRVVYVMSDQGALPLAFSRSVAELRASGLLAER